MTRFLAILGTSAGLAASLGLWFSNGNPTVVGGLGLIAIVGLVVAERATRKLGGI